MKRFITVTILIITFFVLEGTFFQALSFAHTTPNLLLILTVSIGLMRGEKAGLLTGFFSGLLLDIFIGSAIGLYAMIFMYIGYSNGSISKVFFPEDVKLPMIMIVVSDIVYGFIIYVLMFLLRGKTDVGHYFIHEILPEAIYTILITLIIYPLILQLNKLLEKDEIRKAKKFVS